MHQKYLFREFNKERNKGDFVVIHLNPDILHTIQKIESAVEIIQNGGEPEFLSPVEIDDVQKFIDGHFEIPFLDEYQGTRFTCFWLQDDFFVPKNNYIQWAEAKQFFLKLVESSFNYHLKDKFLQKLYKSFKRQFFNLKDFSMEDAFYGDERDTENENGIHMEVQKTGNHTTGTLKH